METPMDMPDLKPIERPMPQPRSLQIIALMAFILFVFGFAFWINLPEWR